MVKNTSNALKSSCENFCSFIGPSKQSGTEQKTDENKSSSNFLKTVGETERIADGFPSLLDEASNEPNFWKRPFLQIKDRYDDIAKSFRRISADIRYIHRCTTILKAESKLHFAQEAKFVFVFSLISIEFICLYRWLVRRSSLAQMSTPFITHRTRPGWTMTELRQVEQVQNDLDIPLTIFMTPPANASTTFEFEQKPLISNNSSASLRLAHMTLYQPVLEHIRTLEKHIQEVLNLSGQLIEKRAAVDIGSLELNQICREDSITDAHDLTKINMKRTLERGPSFFVVSQFEPIPLATNYYRLFSCCKPSAHRGRTPLPSLREAVDRMLNSLIQFLYANNRFIRAEVVANQSIGDLLAFQTLSYALKDLVEATTNIAKNARRIKHIDTRALTREAREERSPSTQIV